MKTPKDILYGLFKQRHIQRWQQFLDISSGRLRIAMYVVNHGNHVQTKDVIAGLTEAGDPRSAETVKRLIRYMKSDGFLREDLEGFLSIKNPVHFVIKQRKGSLLDSWFFVALAVATSAAVINFLENPRFGTVELLLLLVVLLIALRIVDDWFHETTW